MRNFFRYGLLSLGILAVLSAAGVWYLSSRDVGAAYVAQTAKTLAAERFGAELEIGNISGNPVRGFAAESLELSSGGEPVISVRKTRVSLDLLSLLKGSPKIRSVVLEGADVSLEALERLSKGEMSPPTGELPVSRISFDDSVLRAPAGDIHFDRGGVSLTTSGLRVESAMAFKGVEADGEAEFRFGGGNLHMEALDLRIEGARLRLSGSLYPEVDAGGTLTDMDMETLLRLWPEIGAENFSGAFSTNIKAAGTWPDVGARGELAIDKGSIYKVSLAGARSSWWYRGDKLWFEEISGLANGSPVSGTVGLVFRDRPPQTLISLEGSRLGLDAWEKTFPWLSIAGGTLEAFKAELSGSGGRFTGPVRFSSASMEIVDQHLENVTASLELREGGTVGLDATGRWLGAPVDATGNIVPGEGPSYDITVESTGLGLHTISGVLPTENLALQGDAAGTVRIRGRGGSVGYEGELWSERIRVMGELVESPRASFTFEDGELAVKSLSGTFRGLPVKGSGSVSNAGTGNASMNLSGSTGQVEAALLSRFVPALSEAGLSGGVSASWKLSGPASKPSLAMDLKSPELRGFGGVTLSELEASTRIPLPFTPAAAAKITAEAAAASYGGLSLTEPSAAVSVGKQDLQVESFSSGAFSGTLEASGNILLPGQAGGTLRLDLGGTLADADLSIFSTDETPFSGRVTGTFTVTGPVAEPEMAFEASVPELVLRGYMLNDVAARGTARPGDVEVGSFSALIGDGTLQGSGAASFGDGVSAEFSLDGSGLDLVYLTREVPAARKARLEGIVDVVLSGSLDGGTWSGSGEALAETLSAYGFTAEDVYAPVELEGTVAKVEKACGTLYGGSLAADAGLELDSAVWSVDADLSGVDIASALEAAFDMEGTVTGTADLQLSLEHGRSGTMPVRGQGRFSATDGEISGFKAVNAITTAYGGTGIRFNRADSHFSLGGNTLSLMPGSRITAPPGDPLYRYMTVDGSVGFASRLDLYCSGNVNVQALNAFFGALEGLVSSESFDPQQMLENLLGGFLGGMGRRDFRDVSFNVTGSWDKPVITDIKVAVPERTDPIPSTAGDPETKGDERRIHIEIPTGDGTGPSIGDQIRQQILKQIFTGDD